MSSFLALLASEQSQDEQILKDRLSSWSLERLKDSGYTLTGLSAFWLEANQFGRPVASFLIGPGIILPEHRFDNGTQVLVSRIDPLQEQPFQGSIITRTPTQIKVSFPESFDLDGSEWRLDLGLSSIVYDRMRTAISHLAHDPSLLSTCPHTILHGTTLRPILLSSFSPCSPPPQHALQAPDDPAYIHTTLSHPSRMTSEHSGVFSDDMRIASWCKRYAKVNPVRIEGDPVLDLNATQIRTIAMMIGECISLVQGPPGTGKTKTIIEAIKLLKVHFQVPHPILVCTYTNVAVDNLCEGLAENSFISPLRVGYGGKVKASLYEYSLDCKLSLHPLKKTVDRLTEDEERMQKRLVALGGTVKQLGEKGNTSKALIERRARMQREIVLGEKSLAVTRAKMYALRQEMLQEIVGHADVICTTCITSACVALNVVDFPVVFLDEASMSTEPASLIPIMKGSHHVALIGDHKQLPPVITSREAQTNGLGISLFERLTEEGVVPSIMLDVQYRMHPNISRFPSFEFYNVAVQDGTVDSSGNVSPLLSPPASSHLKMDSTGNRPSVVFLDHEGSELLRDRSRVNRTEANIVCSIVEDLLLQNQHLCGKDIGIISPYAAQISLLNRLFTSDRHHRARFTAVLGDHRVMQLADIEVKTVDGFEGREKEVIIFSTVRNNPGGYIGFLADRRRLNVGLTRAKRGLFVVGSISTLRAGKTSGNSAVDGGLSVVRVGKGAEAWRRFVQFVSEEGLVVQLRGEKLGNLLLANIPTVTRPV